MTQDKEIYILGGYQTDFARHFTREGLTIADLIRETVTGTLAACDVSANQIDVGHVSNFLGEVQNGQGHLGGLLQEADRGFVGLPTSRHEAACASGGVAILAAMADLASGYYGTALVVGAELMRSQPTFESQGQLRAAAWVPRETEGNPYPWAHLLSEVAGAYRGRHGQSRHHLVALAEQNFRNAKKNPSAQTRTWSFSGASFAEDDKENPPVSGTLRRNDCSQITDGGAAILLANAERASEYARRRGIPLSSLPRILGFGHRTGRMALADKLAEAPKEGHLFPQVRRTLTDAFTRAGLPDPHGFGAPRSLDLIECHDCFTPMQYMLLDHFGFAAPGKVGQLIEEGTFSETGSCPVNPSGGLMGGGHPVGASGVRMVLDAAKQVRGLAAGYQVPGARRAGVVNVGGSATTTVAFVIGT